MNLKKMLLEAIASGSAERDENGNVTVKIGKAEHLVKVTDTQVKTYEAELEAAAERAADDIADAEATIVSAKAVIEKSKKRKK